MPSRQVMRPQQYQAGAGRSANQERAGRDRGPGGRMLGSQDGRRLRHGPWTLWTGVGPVSQNQEVRPLPQESWQRSKDNL